MHVWCLAFLPVINSSMKLDNASLRCSVEVIQLFEKMRRNVKTRDDVTMLLVMSAELSLAEPTKSTLATIGDIEHILESKRDVMLEIHGVHMDHEELERIIDAELALLGQLTFRGVSNHDRTVIGLIEVTKQLYKHTIYPNHPGYSKWLILLQLIASAQKTVVDATRKLVGIDFIKFEIDSAIDPSIEQLDEWVDALLCLPSSRAADEVFRNISSMKRRLQLFGSSGNLEQQISAEIEKCSSGSDALGELSLLRAKLHALGRCEYDERVDAMVRARLSSFMALRKSFLLARKTMHPIDSSLIEDDRAMLKYLRDERVFADIAVQYALSQRGTELSVLSLLQAARLAIQSKSKSSVVLKELQSTLSHLDKLELQLIQVLASKKVN